MKKIETEFEGLYVIEPRVFRDDRGYFLETFNHKTFSELGLKYEFVQDNESFSKYGTIRGMHFQRGDAAQAKLVRAVRGTVLDVVVDLRKGSKTFGMTFSSELSEENMRMMIIPRGFAHGFAVLSETAIFSYKCDNLYSSAQEGGLLYSDPTLGIDWKIPEDKRILSDKDRTSPTLSELAKTL